MSAAAEPRVGYLELLRGNPNYRRLWLGDIASLFGDWFHTIALYTLVRQLTASPFALGLLLVTKVLPFALASPLSGLLTDRFNRRRLMIASDLARALVVAGFFFIDQPDELPLLYLLAAVQMMIGAVFVPARSASIPNITTARELLTANALSAATWSTLLAVGAAVGGFVTDWLGVRAVFLLDSLSYCVSALFIFRAAIPQRTDSVPAAEVVRRALGDVVAGWRHMRERPQVGRMAIVKAAWATGGGALVFMLTLMGERLEPLAPAVGIGLLYAARGLGTGVGPIAVRARLPDESKWPTMIGFGIIATGATYLLVGLLPWTLWILLLVVLAHAPSGANWVASSVLLQKRTVDEYRGRVFATEWLLLTLVDTLAILAASLLLESGRVGLRGGIVLFAALQVACGLLWLAVVAPRERTP